MRLWYLSHRRTAEAQASLRFRAVSPEHSLFAHMEVDEGSNKKSDIYPHWMAAHARLKNELTENERCHNLMSWLKCFQYLAACAKFIRSTHFFVNFTIEMIGQ